jgi:hypothetical protein
MRERLEHEMNGSASRSGLSRNARALRAREKRLAHKVGRLTHEKNRSRTRKTVRAEPEPFVRSRRGSDEVRGPLLVSQQRALAEVFRAFVVIRVTENLRPLEAGSLYDGK